MIHSHHTMLSPVIEIIKATDAYVPNGDHTFFQKLWLEETQAVLTESLHCTEASDIEKKQSFDALHLISDAISIFTKEAKNPAWSSLSLEERKEKVRAIQTAPQIPQRSEEWYRQFGKVLTASEFSALMTQNKRRRDLVMSKARPVQEQQTNYRTACPTSEMTAIGWGIRFEPVVKQLLEYRDKCKIFEPGRLNHPTNTHLAASPDGVIESALDVSHVGRLVEIKCPYSRTIGSEIPSDYWIQMQIQMEVTDVDECEYIEVDLLSTRAKQEESSLDLSGTTYQGFVYLLKQRVDDDQPFEYKYLYGDIGSNEMPPLPDGFDCIEIIPWGLKSWHRKLVHRDRAWYTGTLAWQEAFWRDVEAVKNGQEIQVSTPKQQKQTPCLITDD